MDGLRTNSRKFQIHFWEYTMDTPNAQNPIEDNERMRKAMGEGSSLNYSTTEVYPQKST